jgi:enamine deaminase RidA (YjgF/YER057c/UK114 family)
MRRGVDSPAAALNDAFATSKGETRMQREVVTGADLPAQFGPDSHAVRAGGFVYVSGQPELYPETGGPAGLSFAQHARQAFTNLDSVRRAAGSRG